MGALGSYPAKDEEAYPLLPPNVVYVYMRIEALGAAARKCDGVPAGDVRSEDSGMVYIYMCWYL